MAKQQDLPLAPSEISGLCGRLLCCLAYENDQYSTFKKSVPKVGRHVITPHGEGVIVGLNVLSESAVVELAGDRSIEVKAEDIQEVPRDKDASSEGKRRH